MICFISSHLIKIFFLKRFLYNMYINYRVCNILQFLEICVCLDICIFSKSLVKHTFELVNLVGVVRHRKCTGII